MGRYNAHGAQGIEVAAKQELGQEEVTHHVGEVAHDMDSESRGEGQQGEQGQVEDHTGRTQPSRTQVQRLASECAGGSDSQAAAQRGPL